MGGPSFKLTMKPQKTQVCLNSMVNSKQVCANNLRTFMRLITKIRSSEMDLGQISKEKNLDAFHSCPIDVKI